MSERLAPRLRSRDDGFEAQFDALLGQGTEHDDRVVARVGQILAEVHRRGDSALLELTEALDGTRAGRVAELVMGPPAMERAWRAAAAEQRDALGAAADRIRRFHGSQLQESWQYRDEDGNLLGQKVTPLDRVGLYVPGGKASYPSSVLMNAIPARVAGVEEVVMVAPAPRGELNPLVLAAAHVAGVDEVITIGGAQAIAALAYGTESIRPVDKIVGPGNQYVATAKRLVFGRVGIDMIAGPSEIVIVCDGATDPAWVAMDLFSQAEHDEDARAILIATDAAFIDRVEAAMAELITSLGRADIITRSLAENGALIEVGDLAEAVELVNRLAPEHLELSVADPESLAREIRHAGAIFLGRHTAEAVGDYCGGPNHVLPTARTARFSSPLGVYDFQKRTSLIGCSVSGAARLGEIAAVLALSEGLDAHARSALMRREGLPDGPVAVQDDGTGAP